MAVPGVFEQLSPFGFVHHRALNSRESLERACQATKCRSDLTHVMEGDICWNLEGGMEVFYFHHPSRLVDVPRRDEIVARRDRGCLFTLRDLLDIADPSTLYVIELKTGVGALAEALPKLVGILQEGLKGRFWLDAFSLRQLKIAKQADPHVPTSLHTKLVYGSYVLKSAAEFPPIGLHHMGNLSCVDAITLTYASSSARWLRIFGATIDSSCRSVFNNGKTLILGGLSHPDAFQIAHDSRARAGYAKFPIESLPRFHD